MIAMLLLLPVGSVRAAVTERDLLDIYAGLAPRIETLVGRTFIRQPPMILDDRAHVKDALLTASTAWRELAGSLGDTPPQTPESFDRLLDHSSALYDPQIQTIYMLSDQLRDSLSVPGTTPAMVRPFVECVLAHELTHALQDQYSTDPFTGTSDQRALVEGQAVWVARQICSADIGTFNETAMGVGALFSRDVDDPSTYAYGIGGRFVDAYVDRYGAGAFWSLLNAPAPGRADILSLAHVGWVRGWERPQRLERAARLAHVTAPGTVLSDVVDPYRAIGALGPTRSGHDTHLPALAGLGATATSSKRNVRAWAFLLDGPDAAAAWIDARRWAVALGSENLPTPMVVSYDVRGEPRLSAVPLPTPDLRVDRTLRFTISLTDGAYTEAWLAQGPLLLGLGIEAHDPLGDEVGRALLALVEEGFPIEGDPATADSEAVLRRLAPPPVVSAVPTMRFQLGWAVSEHLAGRDAECLVKVNRLLATTPPAEAYAPLVLGWECAWGGQDWRRANDYFTLLNERGASARVRSSHVDRLTILCATLPETERPACAAACDLAARPPDKR